MSIYGLQAFHRPTEEDHDAGEEYFGRSMTCREDALAFTGTFSSRPT